jgi:hypothetical protein
MVSGRAIACAANFVGGFLLVVIPLFVLIQLGIFNVGCKPAIYLYPGAPMDVQVRVVPNGIFTETIPEYGNGWSVHATPDGLIDGRYPYLFYETLSLGRFDSDRGWVVRADRLGWWFDENLPRLGLNPNEASEMRDYWVSSLGKDGYYKVVLFDDAMLERFSRLDIDPKPDTQIRVILGFKHLDGPTAIAPPEIVSPQRKGFTVVEWGGVVAI